jgi:hypothetical protein
MKCPKCGMKMEEWGLNTRPVYKCPVHGRIRVSRAIPHGEKNPVILEDGIREDGIESKE